MTAATATRPLSLSTRPLKMGAIGGGVMVFVAAVGMLEAFEGRFIVRPLLTLAEILLFAVPLTMGYLYANRKQARGVAPEPHTSTDLLGAGLVGLIAGLITGGFLVYISAFPGIRQVFPKLSSGLVELMTLGQGLGVGITLLALGSLVAALAGAGVHWLPDQWRKGLAIAAEALIFLPIFEAVIRDLFRWAPFVHRSLYATGGGLKVTSAVAILVVSVGLTLFLPGRVPSVKAKIADEDPKKRRRNSLIAALIIAAIVLIIPQFLGGVLNELLTNVGLFMLMGLGLNIVVGLAGLLDLGYVAFFAVGAYTTAVLTSPLSPFLNPELSWWMAFPFVLVMAAIAGIMVGTPVIRMRGDYLAIVTLGFGEIVRITLLSDWLSPYFGGAQGIRRIPGIPIWGDTVISGVTPQLMIYVTLFFVAVAAYISWRVQDSRIGRAWAAMREDEDVAEAVGVDTVKAKLQAFVMGAILASFAGALFAAKIGSVFTNSFEILVSIIILVIVIVGGMGNIAGVAVGALVLIGVLGGPNQPGLLQELGEFKLLIYGALLVFMMLQRPEGLVPSARRAQELHQEEFLQDAWLDKGGEFVGAEEKEGAKA